MIDFIKINISEAIVNPEEFYRRPFASYVDETTGEILDHRKTSTYGQMKIIATCKHPGPPSRVELSGSIHKHAKGGFNDERFSFNEIVDSVSKMTLELGIDPHKAKIENVEFGVNLPELSDFQKLMDELTFYKLKPFVQMNNAKGRSIGKICWLHDYCVKAYSKSAQLNGVKHVPLNTCRFELKFRKARILESNFRMTHLTDLVDPTKLIAAAKFLESSVDGLLFIPPIHAAQNIKEIACLGSWTDPAFQRTIQGGNRSTLKQQRILLKQIIDNYEFQHLECLKSAISKELRSVLELSPRSVAQAKYFQQPILTNGALFTF